VSLWDSFGAKLAESALGGGFSGVVLVQKAGRTVFEFVLGSRCVESQSPIVITDAFRIGCVGKQFLAAAFLLLETSEGNVIERPFVDFLHLPPGRSWNVGMDRIRVRNLLNGTSGVASLRRTSRYAAQIQRGLFTRDEILDMCGDLYPVCDPGVEFRDAVAPAIIASLCFEQIVGREFEHAIAEVLGAHITLPSLTTSSKREGVALTSPHAWRGTTSAPLTVHPLAQSDPEYTNLYGTCALAANASDLVYWCERLMLGQLLSPSQTSRMLHPGLGKYGLGIVVWTSDDGTHRLWHHGGAGGYAADLIGVPERNIVVCVLQNRGFLEARPTVAQEALALALSTGDV
jgi:CubicO group peptidase (beta-lactamase class C family)